MLTGSSVSASLDQDGRETSLPLSFHEVACHGNARRTRWNVHQSCRELLTRLWSSQSLAESVDISNTCCRGISPTPCFVHSPVRQQWFSRYCAATITTLERAAETPAEALSVLAARIRPPPLTSRFKNAFQALSSVPVNRPAKLSDQGFMKNWRLHKAEFISSHAHEPRVKYVSQFVVSRGGFYSKLWRQTLSGAFPQLLLCAEWS